MIRRRSAIEPAIGHMKADGKNYGQTALMSAKNVEVAQRLIAHHADVNAREKFGFTALMTEVMAGSGFAHSSMAATRCAMQLDSRRGSPAA